MDSNLEARRPGNLILTADYADERGLIGPARILSQDFCFSFITLSLHLIREIRVIRGNLDIRN